jgi:hypothetical protein
MRLLQCGYADAFNDARTPGLGRSATAISVAISGIDVDPGSELKGNRAVN